jgi:DNA-binding CsgD family transcriptional regulator
LYNNQIKIRNLGIVALMVLAGLGIFYINKKRKSAIKDKKIAAEQLNSFIEKYTQQSTQLELMQKEFAAQTDNKALNEKIDELTQMVILTEDDWLAFQKNYNMAYPGYIRVLKQSTPNITDAELRLALLMRLGIPTKQIAQMQGISNDTVYKTKQRLRARLNVESTQGLEEILKNLN